MRKTGLICRLRLKLLLWNYAFKRLGNQSQNPRQKWFRYQNKRHQTQKMKMKRKEHFPKQRIQLSGYCYHNIWQILKDSL